MTGGSSMTGDAAMVRSETRSEPGGATLTSPGFSADSLGRGLLAVLRYLRPSDGWAAVALLAVNLIVVVWSVEHADWVPTPNLVSLIMLAMLTGLVLARVPLWGLLILPVGVVIGLGVIVWQITSFEAHGMELANAAELWERLKLWFVAAKTGNINIDREPFAFALMSATWLAGYLAGWVFNRYRNFWGVFVLGGAGLLSNLTYLPAEGSVYLGIYMLTALLLVARIQAVRRLQEWRRNGFQADGHLSLLSLSDSVLMSFVVLLIAFLVVPTGRFWDPAHDVYEYMRSPLVRWEDDFNRLFAGLPARRPLPYRIWGDVMAFQGTINPTTTPVLQVNSPVGMYWKARSYGTYTPKGWISEDTVLKSTDWTPTHAVPRTYAKRFEVSHTLTPNYRTRNLFAGGQIISSSQDVIIETYDSPVYNLDLATPTLPGQTYPKLELASLNMEQVIRQSGLTASRSQLAQAVPRGFELVDVRREDDLVQSVSLAEVLPAHPDTLSLRTERKEFKQGEAYEVTSSVSLATDEDLRLAGLDYPTWALAKYTQLPPDLPQRVRDLGDQLAAGAETPYDKAKAIEAYLKTFPYSLQLEPPPFNADGVDHFLFDQKKGYSEYFASAMTVLLRTQGIPTRMVTGYSVGDRLPDYDIYIVTDSHSHGWVEVFFPRYGWIGFEPTPGATIPLAVQPVIAQAGAALDFPVEDTEVPLCDFQDEEECDEDFMADRLPATPQEGLLTSLVRRYLPWVVGFMIFVALVLVLAWFFWRRYLVPSTDPLVTFRHLAFLGRLNAVGPSDNQTPYQYLNLLQNELPRHREQLSVIVGSYVRSLYGRKETTEEDDSRLTRAWLELRLPLLFHLLRRRDREIAQV